MLCWLQAIMARQAATNATCPANSFLSHRPSNGCINFIETGPTQLTFSISSYICSASHAHEKDLRSSSLKKPLRQRYQQTQELQQKSAMATRIAARYISRRLSSGKILSEEEKAAENVYIKKTEQEKLEKLARKGYKPEEQPASTTGATTTDAKPSGPASSTSRVSTDKDRNYAVVAGVVAAAAALGWYLKSNTKKPEEVQD